MLSSVFLILHFHLTAVSSTLVE